MNQQRLIFFCPQDTELPQAEAALRPLLEHLGMSGALLRRMLSPLPLDRAGLLALTLQLPGMDRTASGKQLGPHLLPVARTLAPHNPVSGIWIDEALSQALAVHCPPGAAPHVLEGAPEQVVVGLAGWLKLEPLVLADTLFPRRKPQPADGDALGSGVSTPPESALDLEPDPGPDEEDQFVSERLAHARKWMERYRGR